jgi:branched-chain amino acid transport system substrate-binding protein
MIDRRSRGLFVLLLGFFTSSAMSAEPLRVAFIGTLSGAFALQGQETLKTIEMAVDQVNATPGSRKIALVRFDNKASPQESVIALKQAIDQDIHFVISGVSNVAHALIDAVAKHNERNPDRAVLFLDYGALDPALTESHCSFWHFRFESHADTQVKVLIDYLARDASIHKVYLVNQDYAYGQAVSRAVREHLGIKRPDIEIVGDDLVPLGKVKDFSPYVAKIRGSGADAVVTGNWGNDLSLLIRAGRESGLPAVYYTLLAAYFGTAREIGADGVDRVKAIYAWNINAADSMWESKLLESKARLNAVSNLDYLPAIRLVKMLSAAIEKGRSTDPTKVAYVLEGLHYAGPSGESWIRPEDHQVVAPIYVLSYQKAGSSNVKHDAEGTGFGWKVESIADAKDATPALKCRMERVPRPD